MCLNTQVMTRYSIPRSAWPQAQRGNGVSEFGVNEAAHGLGTFQCTHNTYLRYAMQENCVHVD